MKAWVLIVIMGQGGYAIDNLPSLEACQKLAELNFGVPHCFEYEVLPPHPTDRGNG